MGPMEYVALEWLHVLSWTLLFGTGLGTAYYPLFVSLRRDPRAIAVVARYAVLADWVFTTPTMVFQPLSGWHMAHLAGLPLSTPWIAWSFALRALAGACWLPAVRIQIRMRTIAEAAARDGTPMPTAYWQLAGPGRARRAGLPRPARGLLADGRQTDLIRACR